MKSKLLSKSKLMLTQIWCRLVWGTVDRLLLMAPHRIDRISPQERMEVIVGYEGERIQYFPTQSHLIVRDDTLKVIREEIGQIKYLTLFLWVDGDREEYHAHLYKRPLKVDGSKVIPGQVAARYEHSDFQPWGGKAVAQN